MVALFSHGGWPGPAVRTDPPYGQPDRCRAERSARLLYAAARAPAQLCLLPAGRLGSAVGGLLPGGRQAGRLSIWPTPILSYPDSDPGVFWIRIQGLKKDFKC